MWRWAPRTNCRKINMRKLQLNDACFLALHVSKLIMPPHSGPVPENWQICEATGRLFSDRPPPLDLSLPISEVWRCRSGFYPRSRFVSRGTRLLE